MSDGSTIEWLARPGTKPATWNPVRGCTRVSPGCGGPGNFGGCYAEAMAARFSDPGMWGEGFAERVQKPDGSTVKRWTGRVELVPEKLAEPLRWRDPRTIFVNSTSNLFHEKLTDEDIDRVFAVAALTPQHTLIVLTKRSARMRAYMAHPEREARWMNAVAALLSSDASLMQRPHSILGRRAPWLPLPNVWLGVSAERQQEADKRVPDLMETPAAVRFVSAEPLLGPIDFERILFKRNIYQSGASHYVDVLRGGFWSPWGPGYRPSQDGEPKLHFTNHSDIKDRLIDWIIVGGESGPTARPMHPDWARAIRDQCASAGVPFFFKQWGAWSAFYDRDHDDPDWRRVPKVDNQLRPGATRWNNLAGGIGFHGERVIAMRHIGKAKAGHLLDGREHLEFPKVAA